MAYTDWNIKGRCFGNCNCDYGCPCQFNSLPTHGDCKAVVGYVIDEGYFGNIDLSGLKAALIAEWPKAIHEGNGRAQFIIDKNATDEQHNALVKIFHGEECEPGATLWSLFGSTFTKVFDPIKEEIIFEVDIETRKAKLIVPGIIESKGEPIKNPVTGEEHRARINLPNGFEYTVAEMGSGTSTSKGTIPMELVDSYGQFNEMHHSTQGIVR